MLKKLLLLIAFIICTQSAIFSQKKLNSINENLKFRTFSETLNNFTIKYGYHFKYDFMALEEMVISANLKNKTVEEALNFIISKNNLNLKFYKNKEEEFVIVPKDKKISKDDIWVEQVTKSDPVRFNFTLSGTVRDKNTGERLPYATISLKNKSSIHTLSNVDGYFTLPNVPSDTVALLVSYVGYTNTSISLKPDVDIKSFLIELDTETQNLNEVQVTADKTEVVKANEIVGMIKMTPKNIAKLPNIGERDPFRAFQLMPGVSASNESSSGLFVRGGTPDQTLVLYDGFTVYNVDHLFGFFSAFNYNAIKDIQLFKGGFDARFGGRISAVAEITGKQGDSKKFNAGADLSLLSTNAFVEAPLGKKASFLIAGRRSYKGPLYNKIFNKFTSNASTTNQPQQMGPGGGRGGFGGGANTLQATQTAASFFYDLNAKLTYQPTKKDILAVSIFNGTDDMDNSSTTTFAGFGGPFGGGGGGGNLNIDLNSSTNDVAEWGNTGASLKWSRHWTERFYSNALVSYSNYYSERDNSRNISITRNDTTMNQRLGRLENNDLSDVSAKIDFEYRLQSNQQIEFGAQVTQNTISFLYTQNDTTKILDRKNTGVIANIYLQNRMSLLDGKLQVIPGIRATNFDLTKKNYFEPRLSANYSLTPKLKLKGAVGTYYQFVKQINREDISLGNRNFWIMADGEDLPVTKSNHIIIGGSYETPNYLFDVEFYQKKNYGITEYTLRFVPDINLGGGMGGPGGPGGPRGGGGLAVSETFFNGNETIQGVDILVQRKFGNFNGWLGYTFAQAIRNISAFSDKSYYSDQDVRHQFKAVGLYKVKNWDLAATFIYSTGRPYTSVIGAYQLTLLDGTTKDFTNPSDKNANRLSPYNRLDLSATYNFPKLSIGLSVFNAYNRTNVWYKRFEVIREQDVSALQVTDVTYLGVTPNITVSYKLK
ncbi:MAG: TonB-dependent receptor [Bacteroidota bacterium]